MKAFNFALLDQHGRTHKLSDYRGKWVIVYFYPKDDTPGCTKEACSFRDLSPGFEKRGIVVIGISKDTTISHKKFAEKFSLNFTLLADPTHETIEKFGAWGKKNFMGREFFGTLRNTYLINPKGEIVREYHKVNPLTHTQQILSDFDKLNE